MKAHVVPSSMPLSIAAAVGEVRHCTKTGRRRRTGAVQRGSRVRPAGRCQLAVPHTHTSQLEAGRCVSWTHPVAELGGCAASFSVGNRRRRTRRRLRRRRRLRVRLPLLRLRLLLLVLVLGRRKGVQACSWWAGMRWLSARAECTWRSTSWSGTAGGGRAAALAEQAHCSCTPLAARTD